MTNKDETTIAWPRTYRSAFAGFALAMLANQSAIGAEEVSLPGRAIAYAAYEIVWALYETKTGKEECPDGLNELGPREQFKLQFPANAREYAVAETQLAREADIWFPSDEPDQFPFRLAAGKIAPGLDLDGKAKPADFTSPDGVAGIDNQLFRAIGCIVNYRGEATIIVTDKRFSNRNFNRIIIEFTDVDSLTSDDDVTLTVYRGLDPLAFEATGTGYAPGGTQRLDLRWGKEFIRKGKGKIVEGVFHTTQSFDFLVPRDALSEDSSAELMRDSRFQLKLTKDKAEGVIGGYADLESLYRARIRNWSTHHLSYGQQASASMYRALRKLADAYPDPATGEHTAISAAYNVKMVNVYVLRSNTQPVALEANRPSNNLPRGKKRT